MTAHQKSAHLRKLKNQLIRLQDHGIDEIPCNSQLDLSSASARPSQSIPIRSGQTGIAQALDHIRAEMGDCDRCKLCEGRKNIVFGSGNPNAQLVFVGEGPGAEEDEQGLPFVGRAGKKLTEIIEKGMGLNRAQDTYICNIVKCRPPGNRDPESDEVSACIPFLEKQLQAIHPKVIVTLGKPATETLLGRKVAITKERGQWQEYKGIKLMPTFHPAYLLRAYTLENRKAVHEDMKKALAELKR
ncbi:MAG: uracil-DNA glycosylase [Nitrospinae bacterium CG11_big_fil_rev_8_21_14_0_20_45_15]|nr:MAG: uracil-DNA glycosylase [Nitrospinae bacterium CG11_big_fil_rev_8_21_14_0_20_45_15]